MGSAVGDSERGGVIKEQKRGLFLVGLLVCVSVWF